MKKHIKRFFESTYKVNPTLSRMLFNHEYKFIYCPIPKVANSSFHYFILQLSRVEMDLPIHHQLNKYKFVSQERISFASLNKYEAQKILSDNSYLKFVFVRNPWDRLFSAYIDKFVKKGYPAAQSSIKPVINYVYGSVENRPVDYLKSITFRQFVDYVYTFDDSILNRHWKSQYSFLGGLKYDFTGKFENLNQDFSDLCTKLEIPREYQLPHRNKNKYSREVNNGMMGDKLSADLYPEEIKSLGYTPDISAFYTSEIVDKVAERYQKDIELFNYFDARPC